MSYRDLLAKLNAMNSSQLDQPLRILNIHDGNFYTVDLDLLTVCDTDRQYGNMPTGEDAKYLKMKVVF